MNRLIDFNQPNSVLNTRYSDPILDLRYSTDQQIRVIKKETDTGLGFIIVPFTNRDGLVFPVHFESEWLLDLTTTGVNTPGFIGGIIDGLGLDTEVFYHVWAFADIDGQPIGFGLTQQPTSEFQLAVAGVKGTEITVTNMIGAFKYTIDSRVRVLHNNVTTAVNVTDWNLGTVTSIESTSSIKILLDNNKVFGTTYGATIPVQASTGGLITQLDKFRPVNSSDSTQAVLWPYYRIIGILKTDNTAAPNTTIDGFNTWPIVTDEPINTRIVWDGTLTSIPPLLTDDWQFTDGLPIRVDHSPLIGQATPTIAAPVEIIKVR